MLVIVCKVVFFLLIVHFVVNISLYIGENNGGKYLIEANGLRVLRRNQYIFSLRLATVESVM